MDELSTFFVGLALLGRDLRAGRALIGGAARLTRAASQRAAIGEVLSAPIVLPPIWESRAPEGALVPLT
jgi:hypothetical protein